MYHKPVSLEDIPQEEKDILVATARRALYAGFVVNIVPFLVAGIGLAYLNTHYIQLGLQNEDNILGFVNFVLVIFTVLPARLFINRVIAFSKASNAWQKKVVRGNIQGIKGHDVFVSGQKIRLSNEQLSQVALQDNVEIGMNTQGTVVIYIRKY